MLRTLKDINLEGKKVFLRVDFNVPLLDGKVSDDTRIKEALPTIKYILDKGGILSIAAHFGRPKGERNLKYSLKPVADYINEKGYFKVKFIEDCKGDVVADAVSRQQKGEVLLLENLRFYAGEEKNDSNFVNDLKAPYEVYVNDAFGTCHRKHASVYGVPAVMPERAAGLLIEKEAKYFDKIVKNPDRPFAAILGGAKVSDKIGVIESLLDKADKIFIGGAMAYTFLKYQGHTIGTSLVENEQLDTVKKVLAKSAENNVPIFLPVDHVVSSEFGGKPESCRLVDIPDGKLGLDIGTETISLYEKELANCKTILWNGPMGVFENEAYAKGTIEIAQYISKLDATVVVGGGDSVAAVNKAGVGGMVSHISTGGGASLEYVEFGTLPGIEILQK